MELLVAECAFEQWHRLLFARFLAENGLLIHPEFRAPVTLAECEDLAGELGEPDGWAVAGSFASEILPGIFRLDDPCVQLHLAPEGRLELESIVADLPAEVFIADDALGWVYQYWQRDKKKEVNDSERKIGGADLAPVTQLFTENYMVRFLLENSLGAWWAARHPNTPLLTEWEFLRFDEDGSPAAGCFEGWPSTVAEVTVMDPCCGSGHFLVEAFTMLWQMRAEEEALSPVAAQDAVLTDNLFGLELDPRCVQIAMFAIALAAWKAGGGWRQLPTPNIACSGIPVKALVQEWRSLANGDKRLENALVRLHILFRDADTLGSLIDPKRAVEITDPTALQSSFEDVEWDDLGPLLRRALTRETDDPATAVLGADAAGIARAADYLSRHYTLTATNPPYLGMNSQGAILLGWLSEVHPCSKADLATSIMDSWLVRSQSAVLVLPQNWMFAGSYQKFRRQILNESALLLVIRLGPRAFSSIDGEVVQPALTVVSRAPSPAPGVSTFTLDVSTEYGPAAKARAIRELPMTSSRQEQFLEVPDLRIVTGLDLDNPLLSKFASAYWGIGTGDGLRFQRKFWEIPAIGESWEKLHETADSPGLVGGLTGIIDWQSGRGPIHRDSEVLGNRPTRGSEAWGRRGIAVNQAGSLLATGYHGSIFTGSVVAIVPIRATDLTSILCFCMSPDYAESVRRMYPGISVTNETLVKVPFDVERWRSVALERFPGGLPEPSSDNPTQWLFDGRPETATEPLQVAVCRLLGYGWPEQADHGDLDELADDDGIVCLPSVLGEGSASARLQELLARAFGDTWSPTRSAELLAASGSKKKDLDWWLRDEFFRAHCRVFKNRPFIWHIWDGLTDGFAALVNYHRLGRSTLERLTYSYMGDWIERQTAGVREEVVGAEKRLAAAQNLQRQLQFILAGEPPYDIYVRWKSLEDQSIGWDPDLNDGVRMNVRPFVEGGVLRVKFNVNWDRDRGKNPDSSERHNHLHCTRAEKDTARKVRTT